MDDMMQQKSPDFYYYAVAGNIGAGKSSLTTLLAKHYNWRAYYESVDDNPYLSDFYEDMRTLELQSAGLFPFKQVSKPKGNRRYS
jgi:deoxyadenosine/deoxycytidine kinase